VILAHFGSRGTLKPTYGQLSSSTTEAHGSFRRKARVRQRLTTGIGRAISRAFSLAGTDVLAVPLTAMRACQLVIHKVQLRDLEQHAY
jgi:hypothetical protein